MQKAHCCYSPHVFRHEPAGSPGFLVEERGLHSLFRWSLAPQIQHLEALSSTFSHECCHLQALPALYTARVGQKVATRFVCHGILLGFGVAVVLARRFDITIQLLDLEGHR